MNCPETVLVIVMRAARYAIAAGPFRLMPNEGFRNGRSTGQTAGLIPGARAKMRRTDGSKASSGMVS